MDGIQRLRATPSGRDENGADDGDDHENDDEDHSDDDRDDNDDKSVAAMSPSTEHKIILFFPDLFLFCIIRG